MAGVYSGISITVFSYGFILFTGYKMLVFLKKQPVLSAQTRKQIMTLSKVIVMQALVPLVTLGPCIVVVSISIILLYDKNISEYFSFAFISLIPALDPLVPLYFIESYRKAVHKILKCIFFKPKFQNNPHGPAGRQNNELNRLRAHRETLF